MSIRTLTLETPVEFSQDTVELVGFHVQAGPDGEGWVAKAEWLVPDGSGGPHRRSEVVALAEAQTELVNALLDGLAPPDVAAVAVSGAKPYVAPAEPVAPPPPPEPRVKLEDVERLVDERVAAAKAEIVAALPEPQAVEPVVVETVVAEPAGPASEVAEVVTVTTPSAEYTLDLVAMARLLSDVYGQPFLAEKQLLAEAVCTFGSAAAEALARETGLPAKYLEAYEPSGASGYIKGDVETALADWRAATAS